MSDLIGVFISVLFIIVGTLVVLEKENGRK